VSYLWSGIMVGLAGNTSCGTATNGAVYKMKILASSFEVYKDGVLQCTQSTSGTVIDDETVYFQSSAAASVFDDVLVSWKCIWSY
jgi:hypothetical protein